MSAIGAYEGTFDMSKVQESEGIKSLSGHKPAGGRLNEVFSTKGHQRGIFKYRKMQLFTLPKICRTKGKWYVYYHFTVPPELREYFAKPTKRFKIYEMMNSQPPGCQEAYAEKIRMEVEVALRGGYDPFEFIVREKKAVEAVSVNDPVVVEGQPLLKLLKKDYLKYKKSKGVTSERSLMTTINHFEKWLKVKEWTDRGIKLFTEDDFMEFLSYMQEKKKWKGKTYNSNRDYCYNWFVVFKILRFVEENPISERIEKAIESDVVKNEDYQGAIKTKVLKYVETDPVLSRVIRGIYYSCARTYKEFCFIQVKHVDRKGRIIKVPRGKTGYRNIPLCNELEDMLFNEMKIDQYPFEYYLFGFDAMPNVNPVHKNYFSLRYKVLKDEVGLGDNFSMYGWKHTRVCDLLDLGLPDRTVMNLTGHTNHASFEKYTRGMGRRMDKKLTGATVSIYDE